MIASKTFIRLFTLLFLQSLLLGCAPSLESLEGIYPFSSTKLIQKGVSDPESKGAWLATNYSLSADARLLLRAEELRGAAKGIVGLEDGLTDAKLQVTALVFAENTEGLEHLRLCPSTQTWMMLATWESLHPFGRKGRWHEPGGDFQPTECVTATVQNSPSAVARFDLKAWWTDSLIGQRKNRGFILLYQPPEGAEAPESITIWGDQTTETAPQIEVKLDGKRIGLDWATSP